MSNYSVFSNTCPRVRFGGLGDPPYLCHAKALGTLPPPLVSLWRGFFCALIVQIFCVPLPCN